MSVPTVFLFDIDGTLLSSGGAGRRAMERAFFALTGQAGACSGFSMAGMTDRLIVRTGLRALGEEPDPARIDAVLDCYLDLLPGEIEAAVDYRLCRGIPEALDAVGGLGHAVGLGTGNVQRGARIKLGRAGIGERFAFGGFGCDAEDRAELVAIGADRGARQLGLERSACRVVVIGDTPRDVAAAAHIGAESIAVATGPFGVDALRACGPTWAFADLSEAGALAALLG